MNTNTLDKMRQMRLLGMYTAFKTSLEAKSGTTITANEMAAILVESE